MALPPLELFSLKKEAALLPGGFFHFPRNFLSLIFCAFYTTPRAAKIFS
jgi:hypothetical protein